MRGGQDRQKNRAKTFPGIARAMDEQWAGEENAHTFYASSVAHIEGNDI